MIITRVHIENFGKLNNVDFSLSKGLNQIYKENGWGKSSLSIFIKAMFYGMSPKSRGEAFNYERTKYMPWQGGNYGGFIEIENRDKTYRITRYFAKTPEGDTLEIRDLQSNRILQNSNEEIGELLFGVGRESYEITAFFSQLKFVSTTNPQLTASLTGADKFQNDLANFNQGIKIIDNKLSQFKKNKPKKDEIEDIREGIAENKLLIVTEEQKLTKFKDELNIFEKDVLIYENKLKEAKERAREEQVEFEKKLMLEDKIRTGSDKLNELLIKKNNLLEKKNFENNYQKRQNMTKILSIMLPTITIVLSILFALLISFSILDLVLGIILIVLMMAVGIIGEYIVLKHKIKLKSLKSSHDSEEKDVDIELQINLLNKEIDELNQEQNKLKNDYEQFKDCQSPNRSEIEDYESKFNVINYEILSKKNQIEQLEKDIEILIDEGEKLQDDYSNIVERGENIDKKINNLGLTKEFMLKARDNVSMRFIVPINKSFNKIIEKFNLKRDFVIDTEWKVKENTNYGTKEFQYSSQGLQDIISFCQRINLIEEVYKKEKPIIILDDIFVNLDEKKLKIAKEIVKEVAKTYQILYLCCNINNAIEG